MSNEEQQIKPQHELKAAVRDRLASAGPAVRKLVEDDLYGKEISRRTAAVQEAIAKVEGKERELAKLEKAGAFAYSATGEKIGNPSFTRDQADAMKKLRDEICRYESALTAALANSDFTKLLELVKAD